MNGEPIKNYKGKILLSIDILQDSINYNYITNNKG